MERGFTRAFYNVEDAGGWGAACVYFAAYLVFVVSRGEGKGGVGHQPRPPSLALCPPPPWQEWGIYWVHRYLHDNRFLYKLLHKPHVSAVPQAGYCGSPLPPPPCVSAAHLQQPDVDVAFCRPCLPPY
jgi:hypothetical protein